MDALAISLLFGLPVAASGLLVARRIDADRPPCALAAALVLGLIVVAGVDLTAVAGFHPIAIATLAIGGAVPGVVAARAHAGTWLVSPRARLVGLAAIPLAIPMLLLPVPLDTDAQGFGLLALALREGGTMDTLAPWRPGIAYLYAPGATLVYATVSSLLGTSLPAVMMGVSHAAVLLVVWLAWDFGDELGRAVRTPVDDRWPWACCAGAAASLGVWTSLLDAHYTAVLALLFTLAAITALLRVRRTGRGRDLAAVTVAVAAVGVTHADSAIVLGLGLAAFGAASLLTREGHGWRRTLVSVTVPVVGAAVLASPWLVTIAPLLQSDVRSPFDVSGAHWRQLVLLHGVVWPALAVAGAIVVVPARAAWTVAMLLWMALLVDASITGRLERLVPLLARFTYPYSVAWHGPLIPYLALGSAAVAWTLSHLGWRSAPRPGVWTFGLVGGAALVVVAASGALLPLTKPYVSIYGAFASANDVAAMRWIRDRAPREARILNYPGDYPVRDWEAHWAPVIAERDAVYFRMQPFYVERRGSAVDPRATLQAAHAEQQAMLAVWRDPADPAHAAVLAAAGIRYVLVPEWLTDMASLDHAWRWRPPARLEGVRARIDAAPYLHLVFQAGGARVYELAGAAPPGRHTP